MIWLFVAFFGISKYRQFTSSIEHHFLISIRRLGSLRLGTHRRSVAPLQSSIRHCSRRFSQLDDKFHRRSDHARHAKEPEIWHISFLRSHDRRRPYLHFILRPGDEASHTGRDGYSFWFTWNCSSSELIILKTHQLEQD